MNLCWAVRREIIKDVTGRYDPRIWDYVFARAEPEFEFDKMCFCTSMVATDRYVPRIHYNTKWVIIFSNQYIESFLRDRPGLRSKQVHMELSGRGKEDSTGEVRERVPPATGSVESAWNALVKLTVGEQPWTFAGR